MLSRVETDLAMTTSSLCCLKLDPSLRKRIADTLIPTSKIKDILYIILIANDRVLTLIRPRKHSIHPADLHIILNAVNTPSVYNNPAPTQWIPFCLPKFNPAGFVNAFISFLRSDEPPTNPSRAASPVPPNAPQPMVSASDSDQASNSSRSSQKTSSSSFLNEHGVALVCISGDADVDTIRTWSETAIKVCIMMTLDDCYRLLTRSRRKWQ